MKVAITGKGGTGKTALSAMLALAFQRRGRQVVAVDLDTNPGLAVSLGLLPDDTPIPDEVVQQRSGAPYGWGLADGLTPDEAVQRYAVPVSDGLCFLGLGNIVDVQKSVKRYVTALLAIAGGVHDDHLVLIADLEAGPTSPYEGYVGFADPWLVVTDASPASMLAAQRILTIAAHFGARTHIVANRVTRNDDVGRITTLVGPVGTAIPFDPQVRALERDGPLLGISATSAAWQAVEELAGALSASERRG
ncbi:MAG: hypothetical protein NVS3B21_30080 [Acidimicrobiales bacterium]